MKSYKVCLAGVCSVVLFAGCKSSSSEGTPNPNQFQTGATSGKYVALKEVDVNYSGHYTVGCLNAGYRQPKYQIDPRLKVGSKKTAVLKAYTSAGIEQIAASAVVTDVNGTKIESDMSILVSEGQPGLPAGMNVKESCVLGQTSLDCTYTPQIPRINFKTEGCEMGEATDYQQRISLGQLTMANGKTINVYEKKVTITGPAKCHNYEGAMITEQRTLLSNDVPSFSDDFCGGTMIFDYAANKKPDGTLIDSDFYEITSF